MVSGLRCQVSAGLEVYQVNQSLPRLADPRGCCGGGGVEVEVGVEVQGEVEMKVM